MFLEIQGTNSMTGSADKNQRQFNKELCSVDNTASIVYFCQVPMYSCSALGCIGRPSCLVSRLEVCKPSAVFWSV
ncbi:hypothetical protein MKW92_013915 [Papaver armeniacum]|nr:hypothetical protein MKW92_013915 [Papaver armeniacum]